MLPISGRDRVRRLIRRLHRWLGLSAAAFVVLLSLTGIALNHSDGLGLDGRYSNAGWLLNWYGLLVPDPTASFSIGDQRVTLMGGRLYLDDAEVDSRIEAMVGAVVLTTELVIATPEELLFLAVDGAIIDRSDLGLDLPAPIVAIASAGDRIILRAGNASFAFDPTSQSAPIPDDRGLSYQWSSPTTVPPALLERIKLQYGGRGISVERLIYDIHSGQILKSMGLWFMDLLAIALILLAASGVWVWFKR